MATQAAQLPAGTDTTLYDLGRMAALWVSAFETLAHPRKGNSGLDQVYLLLENVSYLDHDVRRPRYKAHTGRTRIPPAHRVLPCWLYGKLYQARNNFLHGNPVRAKSRYAGRGSAVGLFWLAPCVYRLALTGFLKLSPLQKPPNIFHTDPQSIIERAILRARKGR
jgi:hypothetical protein